MHPRALKIKKIASCYVNLWIHKRKKKYVNFKPPKLYDEDTLWASIQLLFRRHSFPFSNPIIGTIQKNLSNIQGLENWNFFLPFSNHSDFSSGMFRAEKRNEWKKEIFSSWINMNPYYKWMLYFLSEVSWCSLYIQSSSFAGGKSSSILNLHLGSAQQTKE